MNNWLINVSGHFQNQQLELDKKYSSGIVCMLIMYKGYPTIPSFTAHGPLRDDLFVS